jgi:hypothetical protein
MARSRYPLDYFSPMHPGNGVGIDTEQDDPATFALATRTVTAINAATNWVPESGAQMDWIAAVRLGWNATEFILRASESLTSSSAYPMYPNFYGTDGGGGLETCGVTLALNEMLLQSHEGALRFFPVWPGHRSASFETLRTSGAFLVSAEYTPSGGGGGGGGDVSARIASTVGGNCVVFADDAPTVAMRSGVAVTVEKYGRGKWKFDTQAGQAYTLRMRKGE